MVTIALAIIISLYEMSWPIMVPAVLIMLREVLISGLREFLGEVKIQVTPMAKWKTTMQMFAICLLLVRGAVSPPADGPPISPVIADFLSYVAIGTSAIGLMLLWVAMWLTIVTGWDYFAKGLPYIRGKEAVAATPAAQPED
jgi:CDP-diacylglycerol--glycerol-3-phosphate 3-phosphatidyltransferase